jgi:predicted DNA-binding transcriptional regulator YafY
MVKATGPMQEVARLLDLVPYLSTHSYISMSELAAEFEISERELANELTALSMCGLPGYTPYELIDIFFESGYVSITNHDALDIPRALSQLEVASLLLGLELLKDSINEPGTEIEGEIDSLVTQLRELAGGAVAAEPTVDMAHLAVIQKAIATRQGLLISYISTQRDSIEDRVIEPLSLYFENGISYLSAYCHRSEGYRNFRVDRIEKVALHSIEKPHGSPDELDTSPTTAVSLKLHANRRSNAELFSLSEVSSGGKASGEFFNEEWVIRAVLSASPGVEVLSPPQIRAAIAAEGEKILALYRS